MWAGGGVLGDSQEMGRKSQRGRVSMGFRRVSS